MDEFSLILNMAIVLGAALAGGLAARFLKQSAIAGYLLAGVVIGPLALGLIQESDEIKVLATIGVVLLLFTLGVKLSLREMIRVKRVAIGGGIFQLLATTGLGIGVAALLGWSLPEAVTFGFLVAISSTMVVIGMLTQRGELETVHGRVMIGILLMQDIAAAFMMFILPVLGGSAGNLASVLGLAVLKAGVFLGLVLFLGAWVVPRFIRRVAVRGSRELFVLSGAVLCFGGAFAAYYFGLSAALGAFAVGLLISESDFAHQVLGDMIPLRDIFSAIFFVSVGMLIDLPFMAANINTVMAIVVTIVLGKFVICSTTARLFGYGGKAILLVGAGMIQIGEFSFVLAELGLGTGVISEHLYSLILASAMISIILTPFAYSLATGLSTRLIQARALGPDTAGDAPQLVEEVAKVSDHVVICGHGRVGGNVAQMLRQLQIPHLVIDLDPAVISSLRDQGIPCIYGDAGNREVLSKAGLKDAALLLIAMPDPMAARLALDHALRINPQLDVVVRVHSDFELDFLRERGASELVQPELEASIELTRHVLCRLGLSEDKVQEITSNWRRTCPT
ncbi:MAG: cation:proton antiporter [Dehalococcoidia bacterium]